MTTRGPRLSPLVLKSDVDGKQRRAISLPPLRLRSLAVSVEWPSASSERAPTPTATAAT